MYAKDSKTGEYMSFTGNMSGVLIAEYILSQRKEKDLLPQNGALITSIVSTNLAKAVAEEYNLKFIEVLTGFKFIGEKMRLFDETEECSYQFGFEESYGCLIGTYARDKDAIAAVMMLCEAAAYYKSQGITLWDQMINMYNKYGYYKEDIKSLTLEGIDGADKIKAILNELRENPLENIGGYKVLEFRDYAESTVKNMITGQVTKTDLPKSNVLYYELENDAWCCVRPSGTEPKIKFYLGAKEESMEKAEEALKSLGEDMLKYSK